jgi:ABC-2 type transport system permease protein
MYLALLSRTFRLQFQYRGETFFRIAGNIIRIYIQVCIWAALLGVSGAADGDVTLPDMVTYVAAAFVLRTLTRTTLAHKLADRVRDGSVAVDLIRPVPLIGYMFFEQLSENLFALVFSGLPVIIVSCAFWGLVLPSALNLALFILSALLAVLLMFYIEYIFGLFVFWIKNGTHMVMLVGGLFTVFSGATVPLWFYPPALAAVCEWLPFRLIAFEPISVYLGKYDAWQALRVILLQLVWAAVLIVSERLVWRAVQRRMFIQGG